MKRPRVVVGPGLVLAVLASVLIWWYFRDAQAPPRVLRTPGGPPAATVPGAPDPDWVVTFDVGLSPAQSKRVQALHARWRRETSELRRAVERAEAELAAAAGASPVTMQAVQERGAVLSALSRELAAAHRAWWDDAARLLSPEQRRRVEEGWTRRLRGPDRPSPAPAGLEEGG